MYYRVVVTGSPLAVRYVYIRYEQPVLQKLFLPFFFSIFLFTYYNNGRS